MPNIYLSRDEFKATAVGMGLNITSSAGDSRQLILLESMSREVDRYCNRQFFAEAGTKLYSGQGTAFLIVHDLISVSSIEEDSRGAGTFDTTWGTNDYYLSPYNANPTVEYGRPYNLIELNRNSNGTQEEFLRGQRNYRISGTWGYVSVTTAIGSVAGSFDATATTVSFGTSATIGAFDVGWTVVIDSEQMYVRGNSGTSITVTRGMNGSTATVHASGTNISKHVYPAAIQEAVAIQAGRIFKRAQGGFASDIGGPDGNFTRVQRGMDMDVRELLSPYRRIPVGGL